MLARPELNVRMSCKGPYIYIVTEDGKQMFLCNSMEGQQFALACRCDRWHVRYTTLHNIKAVYDLFCQWCECEEESWKGSGKDEVSASEKEAMQALQSAGLDHTTACQVLLPFWHGRVDFYHIPSQTAIQADGSSHFVCMYHRAPHFQLLSDVDCCRRAWREGYRLLRVHHRYGRSKEAMIVATQLPYASFVMLAGCYEEVVVWCGGKHMNYIDLLKSKLRGAQYMEMGIPGCVIFY